MQSLNLPRKRSASRSGPNRTLYASPKRPRKGMLYIVLGAGGGQLAALVSAPIISRQYSPDDVGVFSVLSAVAFAVAVVAALRFELAVTLPRDDSEAAALVRLGICSTLATGFIGATLAVVFGDDVAEAAGQRRLGAWLPAAPILAAIIGIFSVYNQLALRRRDFGAVGGRNALNGIVTAATQVLAGVLGYRSGGLVVGFGAGQTAGIAALVTRSSKAGKGDKITLSEMRSAVVRYRRFPLVSVPAGLLNVAGLQFPIIAISMMYGSSVAGWLGMTQRVLALPMSLLGMAVSQVFLAELSRSIRTGEGAPKTIFGSASRRLFVLGTLAIVVTLLAGPALFTRFLGAQWEVSGQYAQALSLALGPQLCASPLSQTMIAYERQWMQLLWDIGRLIIVSAAILVADLLWHSPLATIWALGAASGAAYGASWLMSYWTISAADRGLIALPATADLQHPRTSNVAQ